MNKLFCILAIAPVLLISGARAGAPDDISSEIQGLLSYSSVPSMAVAVVRDGEVVAAGAAGIRRVGSPERVTLSDKYHIGSCTKSMTATLAAILVQEGTIRWETTIADVFPDMEIDPGYRSVRLRQLLTNSGGAPGDVPPDLWGRLWKATGTPTAQRMLLVEGITSEAPAYEPGTQTVYSNAGFSIAGAMLEAASGEAWEDLITEKLFIPLGMTSAGFRAPATNGKVDQPYGHVSEGVDIVPVDPEPAGDNPRGIAPADAVHCSVLDFARYAQLHLGRSDIVTKESLAVLHDPGDRGYAMGWIVTPRPWANGDALMHAGSNTMFFAVIWLAPARDFAVVVMCNYGDQVAFQKCDEAVAMAIGTYLE